MGKGKEPRAVQGEKQEVMPGIPQKEKEVQVFILLFFVTLCGSFQVKF